MGKLDKTYVITSLPWAKKTLGIAFHERAQPLPPSEGVSPSASIEFTRLSSLNHDDKPRFHPV